MAEWITTDEASLLSGYSIQYLRFLLREKKIIGEKKGGSYWIKRDSLVVYMTSATHAEDKRHGARKKRKAGS